MKRDIVKWMMAGTLLLLLSSCARPLPEGAVPVVRVNNTYLTEADIQNVVPPNLSKSDSALLMDNYIRSWVNRQLLLQEAKDNLSKEEQDISLQLKDYEASVLIYLYKEKLFEQKRLDSIPEEDCIRYFNDNYANFVLSEPILKTRLIILPISAPDMINVRKWFRSKRTDAAQKLNDYVEDNAIRDDTFGDLWVTLSDFLHSVPLSQDVFEQRYRRSPFFDLTDDNYIYLFKVTDYRTSGGYAPFELVRGDIERILRNKERVLFEDEFEKTIRENGMRKNKVEYYNSITEN